MPFPFIDTNAATAGSAESWEPFREFEWDIVTQEFVIRNGQINVVEGAPAIKIWIYKTLLSQRGRYPAYTWNYGNDLDSLIGADLTRDVLTSEAKRITEEALYTNKHILNLKNFTATMKDNMLKITFVAVTDSGDIEVSI
jgi:hypothetical protein